MLQYHLNLIFLFYAGRPRVFDAAHREPDLRLCRRLLRRPAGPGRAHVRPAAAAPRVGGGRALAVLVSAVAFVLVGTLDVFAAAMVVVL